MVSICEIKVMAFQTQHPRYPVHHIERLGNTTPQTAPTPLAEFCVQFGHYSMGRTTWSYQIPFNRQSKYVECESNQSLAEMLKDMAFSLKLTVFLNKKSYVSLN